MTFHCYTKDPTGNPVVGIYIQANVQETGKTFARSSDGGGYSDVAMQDTPAGHHVTLLVLAKGFEPYTQYLETGSDQEVRITLSPFGGGLSL